MDSRSIHSIGGGRNRPGRSDTSCGVRLGNRKGTNAVGASLAKLYLPPDASAEDAKRAYRGLVRLLHPDLVGRRTEELAAVLAAYRYLEDSGWLAEHSTEIERHDGELLNVRA